MGTANASWQLCKHFLLISIPVADDSEQKEGGKEKINVLECFW